jgi:hypothetical protein
VIGRLEVLPGAGTVARFGNVAVWAGPTASPGLLEFLVQSARNVGPSATGGRDIADHVAGVLRDRLPEPGVPFATAGPGPDSPVVLLHGPIQLWDGTRWLRTDGAPGWRVEETGRVATLLVIPRGASLPPTPTGAAPTGALLDLTAGVVPGGGLALVLTPVPGPRPAPAPEPAPDPPPETNDRPPPDAVAGPPLEPTLGPRAVDGPVNLRLLGPAPVDPLPPGDAGDVPPADAVTVSGLACPQGHLNHPRSPSCLRCGVPLDDAGGAVRGPRPPLGILIGSDNRLWRVDADYLIGSAPDVDPSVRPGGTRPLVVDGDDRVAPVHAELRVSDWALSVVDRNSPAGTFVLRPGEEEWVAVPPSEAVALTPGSHLAVGSTVLTFSSPWPP